MTCEKPQVFDCEAVKSSRTKIRRSFRRTVELCYPFNSESLLKLMPYGWPEISLHKRREFRDELSTSLVLII